MKKLLSVLLATIFVALSCVMPSSAFANEGDKHAILHDPSIVKSNEGKYYMVGSHLGMYKSDDMISWESLKDDNGNNYAIDNGVSNYLGDDWKSVLAEPLKWTDRYQALRPDKYNDSNHEYNCWANDIIYNEQMGKYCLYGAVSLWGEVVSVIWLCTSDNIEGPYEYVDSLIYTGITKYMKLTFNGDPVLQEMDFTNTDILDKLKGYKTPEDIRSKRLCNWFTEDGYYNCWWGGYPNAIDPTVYTDKNGGMWLTYGSYSGGCYVIKLKDDTGLPDYDYMSTHEGYDVYYGKQISKTNAGTEGTGEGPYIVYDNVNDYYYFFLTYGGLNGDGGYNIREYRSKNPDGPYVDVMGNAATDEVNSGLKLDGNYQFSCQPYANLSGGHSSCLVDDDGSVYQVYHSRNTADWSFKSVVHKMVRTTDGWLAMLPYEYNGEKTQDSVSADEIVGKYEFIDSTNMTQRLEPGADIFSIVLPTQGIRFNADGTITGARDYSCTITNANTGYKAVAGTWSQASENSVNATIKLGTVTYNCVFNYQFDEDDTSKEVLSIAGVGTDNSTIFAVKNDDVAVIEHEADGTTTTKATTSKNGSVVSKCVYCGKIMSSKTICYPKTITLSATKYTYDGNLKKPAVTVKGSDGKTISSSNYTVTYSNNKLVGKASVKITFKGNYSGSVTKNFVINPKGTSVSKLTAASKGFKATWKKQATQTTGYQIQYATNSGFTKDVKTVTVSKNSTVSKSITKLKAKKKYYVRVRTYKTVGSTKYYSSWSSSKYVTTKK